MIEIGRYKNLETEERLCKLCITQKIEDEYHFLIDCAIYNSSRKICYPKISELCSNFNMSDKSKFYYFFYQWRSFNNQYLWKMYNRVPWDKKTETGFMILKSVFFLFRFILLIFFKALNPTRNIVFIYFYFFVFFVCLYNCLQWQWSMYAICLPLLWAHWLE